MRIGKVDDVREKRVGKLRKIRGNEESRTSGSEGT